MLAVVRHGTAAAVTQVAEPRLVREGDALVMVELAGVCRTDVYAARGAIAVPDSTVLGHEAVGVVLRAGVSAQGLAEGDRVAIDPWLGCGQCAVCARAKGRCAHARLLGVHLDGVFAELLVVPAVQLHRLPAGLSSKRAAYVEPVAAALAVLDVDLDRAGRGLVYGQGRIATLVERVLLHAGFSRVERGTPTGMDAYDFIVEAQATDRALREVLEAVRPGGTVVLKSRPAGPVALDVGLAVRKDLTLRGASYGTFGAAIDLLASARFDVDDLLGEVHPLSAALDVLARDERSESTKLFLAPRGV